jgi:eukaryotic-like serine/threonine-protein kinase
MRTHFRVTKRTRNLAWVALGAAAAVILFQVAIMPIAVKHAHDAAVPDLHGLSASDAAPLIERAALTSGSVTEVVDDFIPAGRIVRQSPQAGARVRRGRQIDLVVSAGPTTHRVPKLAGETLFHARFVLQREEIRIGKVRRITHRSLPADCVVASWPQSGTPLGRRPTVDLLVSSGPPPTRFLMPDLRGLDAQAVKRTLQAAGMQVRQRTRPTGGERAGEVVEQTPPPGYPLEAGGTVEIMTGS